MSLKTSIAAVLVAAASTTANAAQFHFEGNIANHNDVIFTTFTVENDATDVRLWTDSFLNGINFDPITALWNATTGELLAEADDNASINPSTQTIYDSGFLLDTLSAGTYIITVATFDNFAVGTNLSQGFDFDSDTGIPMSEWCQPFSECNMGTYWSVWLDGVDSATNPDDNEVPAPASLGLLAAGLMGLGFARRKQKA